MLKVKLREVHEGIYVLDFKRHYELAMHFLRVQETYESANPLFRNRSFTLVDFMDWYIQKYKRGGFSYPFDWGGFNVPSTIMEMVYGKPSEDPHGKAGLLYPQVPVRDWNKYDDYMAELHLKLSSETPRYYLVGVSNGNKDTLAHEVAHGLYFTNPQYRRGALELLAAVPKPVRKRISTYLKKLGYANNVLSDEAQAYLATGLTKELRKYASVRREQAPFRALYKKYASM